MSLYQRFVQPYTYETRNVLMSRIQEAYWFYCDHLKAPHKKCWFRHFVAEMALFLDWPNSPKDVQGYVRSFWRYNNRIPRCGGALLNRARTHIVLVRNCRSKKWTFPAGKKNPEETDYAASAAREVFEETGVVSPVSSYYFTYRRFKATHSIFLFLNVPFNFKFHPVEQNEIAEIKWVPLNTLSQYVCKAACTKLARCIEEVKQNLYPLPPVRPAPESVWSCGPVTKIISPTQVNT